MPHLPRRTPLYLFVLVLLGYSQAANDNDNEYTVCQDAAVAVVDLVLVCDSPGAYYYGSGKYRNSASCQAGDKAKVSIELEIAEDSAIYQADDDGEMGGDAYLTIAVPGYGSIPGVSLYQDDSLCEALGSDECPPAPGNYSIYERFYWGDQNDAYPTYSFVPRVTVGIASAANKNKYDLGGANTNQCNNGSSLAQWTHHIRTSMANTFRSFLITFGVLSGTVLVLVGLGWWIVRQATRKRLPTLIIVDEELDHGEQQQQRYTAMRDPVGVGV